MFMGGQKFCQTSCARSAVLSGSQCSHCKILFSYLRVFDFIEIFLADHFSFFVAQIKCANLRSFGQIAIFCTLQLIRLVVVWADAK